MSQLARTSSERRVERQVERRARHVDKSSRAFRFAGELFGTSTREKERQVKRETRQRLQKSRIVGFGTDDAYGPDEDWDTKESLNSKSYQDYYSNP